MTKGTKRVAGIYQVWYYDTEKDSIRTSKESKLSENVISQLNA